MDNSKVLILIILAIFFLIIVFVQPFNHDEYELTDIHAKLDSHTAKYTYSGNISKSYWINISYSVNTNIDDVIVQKWFGYDKEGNIILEESFEFIPIDGPEEISLDGYDENVYKNIEKIEVKVYKDEECKILLFNHTIKKIGKGENTEDTYDDTPAPTHHRELTEREIIEMDAEAWGAADYGETYLAHDENGNLKEYRKRSSFLSK